MHKKQLIEVSAGNGSQPPLHLQKTRLTPNNERNTGRSELKPSNSTFQKHQDESQNHPHIDWGEPLIGALLVALKVCGITVSSEALCSGLPLVNNQLTPELFVRASKKAGVAVRLVERELVQILPPVLPAVLLLKEHRGATLLSIDHEKQFARLASTHTDDPINVPLDALSAAYTGRLFLLSKRSLASQSSSRFSSKKPNDWFWGTLVKSWRIYRDVLGASLMINLFALATPLYMMNIYDRVVPNQAMDTLWVLTFGILIVFFFDFILRTLRGYFVDIAGKKTDMLLSASLFEQVLDMKIPCQPRPVGAFAATLRDYEHIRDFTASATITLLVDLPFALLFLSLIYVIAGYLVMFPVAGIVLIGLYSLLLQSMTRNAVEQTVQTSSKKQSLLVEALSGMETVKTLGMQGHLQGRWEQMIGHISDCGIRSRLISASGGHVSLLTQQLVQVAIIVAGVYLVQAGNLSMGGLIAAVLLSSRAIAPVINIAGLAVRYTHVKRALVTLRNVMDQPKETEHLEQFLHREQFQGSIRLDSVSFSYPGTQKPALDQVSTNIRSGERIGILGKTGSGKTTLLKLLIKLFDPDEGNIQIDDLNLTQINAAELRSNIGYVDQNPTLFSGTLKENIVGATHHATNEEILSVSKTCGILELANQHPLGFGMPVGERGDRLSSGQRQSVALARMMLNQPKILLLDEPTSALDPTTEERIKKNLGTFVDQRTLLLVTHRLSLLDLVDRIIILDKGRVIADGPHDQIIAAMKGNTPNESSD